MYVDESKRNRHPTCISTSISFGFQFEIYVSVSVFLLESGTFHFSFQSVFFQYCSCFSGKCSTLFRGVDLWISAVISHFLVIICFLHRSCYSRLLGNCRNRAAGAFSEGSGIISCLRWNECEIELILSWCNLAVVVWRWIWQFVRLEAVIQVKYS